MKTQSYLEALEESADKREKFESCAKEVMRRFAWHYANTPGVNQHTSQEEFEGFRKTILSAEACV